MNPWNDITHYAGFDWARDHHAVVLINAAGQILSEFEFDHTPEGWKVFQQKTAPYPNLAIAIETSQGAAVDQLLQRHLLVYPVNPLAAQSYRRRQAPSGTKTDQLDAWGLADALRVDGQRWKPLRPRDPLSEKLRLLCKDQVALIQQRTLLVNQLQQALVEYYPAALEAFADWTASFTWDFLIEFPTPRNLVQAGRRRWEKFLHTHKLWRPETAAKRVEIFARAEQFQGAAPLIDAKSQLAVSLAKVLRTLEQQLAQYHQQIQALFQEHPDHHLFGSLPEAKAVLAPRLLGAMGSDPDRYGSAEVLQCLAGTAPICYQSGQVARVRIRWACDTFLRHTVHLWADSFRRASAWGQTYYEKKRAQGMSHACALRCLGQRLLKILFRLISDKQPYNAELHARNQKKHGSWVLALLDPAAATPSQPSE